MIRADWYKEAMKDAGIPLSTEEEDIIDKITKNGRFNEVVYMRKVMVETPVFLTKNQIDIIRMLAYVHNAIREVGRKNGNWAAK